MKPDPKLEARKKHNEQTLMAKHLMKHALIHEDKKMMDKAKKMLDKLK